MENRTSLLVLHGALGSADQMQVFNELSDSFFVQFFEFSGHGKKERAEDFSMKQFALELADFVSVNPSPDLVIFGYSMGGFAALRAILDHGLKCRALITLGTKFNWTPESAAREVAHLNPDAIEEKVPHFASALKLRHGTARWRTLLHDTAHMMIDLGETAALTAENLQSIAGDSQICIARGSLDNMVGDEESKWAATNLNSRYLVLDGVKHPIEKVPVEMLRELLEPYSQK